MSSRGNGRDEQFKVLEEAPGGTRTLDLLLSRILSSDLVAGCADNLAAYEAAALPAELPRHVKNLIRIILNKFCSGVKPKVEGEESSVKWAPFIRENYPVLCCGNEIIRLNF